MFSSHLDSLNGSVDINLFSWMAIARHSDGNHSLLSWGSKANKCNTDDGVCVYVCAYSFSVIRVFIIVHVSYNRTHPWLYCLANQRYSWHDVGLGPAVHPHLPSSESCLLRISQRL